MAELIPASFRNLVARLYREPKRQDALFDLPRKNWHFPDPAGPDLSVHFHGRRAGNAFGPAAGPHTQMAQNILLSYVAGARIMELKTVQVMDRLEIPRPCIDLATIGYNIEWSQELRVEDSLREYVGGMMLIEMFRNDPDLGGGKFPGHTGEVIYDMSVGYDLAGIKSEKIQKFLDGMADAGAEIEKLRAEIPAEFKFARGLDYPALISNSVTLSTFHGCPAGEIEAISEFLIVERGLNVVVKMNPPMLGKERLEHLLHDVLGYTSVRVNPAAYSSGLQYDEGVALTRRLMSFAQAKGRQFGLKFSNTLEVENHRDFFTPENKVMYLSGQPLHVITMALTEAFRRDIGPHVPITFSAGIDKGNFADAVSCGFCPITASSDLLRMGGFARIGDYLKALGAAMTQAGAANVDEWILKSHGQEDEARRLEREESREQTVMPAVAARWAGWLNTGVVARKAAMDERYRAEKNAREPKRIDSHLTLFDCITCNKCIPVCPNDANFTYPSPAISIKYRNIIVEPSGKWAEIGDELEFVLVKKMQIANYADFCNECGNCDTFCPEYDGPYIMKPSFHLDRASFDMFPGKDGFLVEQTANGNRISGRIDGRVYILQTQSDGAALHYDDGIVSAEFDSNHIVTSLKPLAPLTDAHPFDIGRYHALRALTVGVLDPARVNQVNVAWQLGV